MSTDKAPYRHFDGMCWPVPCNRLHDVAYSLVHAGRNADIMGERLIAASVLSAFQELIDLPAKKRAAIIRELRKGPGMAAASLGRDVKGG